MQNKFFLLLLAFLYPLLTISQQTEYFNYTYQNNFSDISGNSIIEIQNGYLGFGAVHFPDITGQHLIFLSIDKSGNEITWTPFGEEFLNYYPGTGGGKLIHTNDGNLAMAFHIADSESVYGCLFKFTQDLDTIWKMHYNTEADWTVIQNCCQTNDNGYILTGEIFQDQFSDLILLKTDSLGNEEWHQLYGTNWSEKGRNVIQTPDGGYLIGGYFWKPGYDHSLDAMLIKTDSLGNEEWIKYYGNPDVDDDMALVAMADDGNYLVASVYGEWIYSSTYRIGRPWVFKIDTQGQIIEQNKVGEYRLDNYIKNFREVDNGYILSGFSYETDTATIALYTGWGMKIDNNLDSIWNNDYSYYNDIYDDNYLYDISPCQDNGYIAIGKARPNMGGENNMWIVKVDSMGCDTPGCFTTVISEEIFADISGELRVWPNPAKSQVTLRLSKCEPIPGKTRYVIIYNSQGLKVEEIKVPDGVESIEIDVSKYTNGLYYLQYIHSNQIVETVKFIKK